MKKLKFFIIISLFFIFLLDSYPLLAKEEKVLKPKEFGVYIKTKTGLVRLLPNLVFEEEGIFFLESNNPRSFPLKDIQYFIIYGQYDMDVLTFNPLLFFNTTPVGKSRYIFGKDIEIDVKKQKIDNLYMIKPKGLLGRGYFCLWINDSAWDFIIE
ncbi:MAG: hypothetical protein N2596_00775 [Syntrophorhabdaceae bacterium]|nr:hypothetical protein [Syntrophorhabdaceae bacterium]